MLKKEMKFVNLVDTIYFFYKLTSFYGLHFCLAKQQSVQNKIYFVDESGEFTIFVLLATFASFYVAFYLYRSWIKVDKSLGYQLQIFEQLFSLQNLL